MSKTLTTLGLLTLLVLPAVLPAHAETAAPEQGRPPMMGYPMCRGLMMGDKDGDMNGQGMPGPGMMRGGREGMMMPDFAPPKGPETPEMAQLRQEMMAQRQKLEADHAQMRADCERMGELHKRMMDLHRKHRKGPRSGPKGNAAPGNPAMKDGPQTPMPEGPR